MNKLIKNWIDACNDLESAKLRVRACEKAASEAEVPCNMRPANPNDLSKIGNIIWYPRHETWYQVCRVEFFGDDFKAFTSQTGCRYGLNGAFVEIES